jgi:signal peptidase I
MKDGENNTVTFEEVLARDGKLTYRTKGTSMQPMLKENRDLITVEAASSRLRRFDVALYKRNGADVLHRVIRVGDGAYRIRGDNTFRTETVPFENVYGVLTGFVRKGKDRSVNGKGYRAYVRIWNAIYPLRWALHQLRRGAVRVMKTLGVLPYFKKLLRRN